jgi:hypothetical protein
MHWYRPGGEEARPEARSRRRATEPRTGALVDRGAARLSQTAARVNVPSPPSAVPKSVRSSSAEEPCGIVMAPTSSALCTANVPSVISCRRDRLSRRPGESCRHRSPTPVAAGSDHRAGRVGCTPRASAEQATGTDLDGTWCPFLCRDVTTADRDDPDERVGSRPRARAAARPSEVDGRGTCRSDRATACRSS